MSSNSSTQELIASALALPIEDRLAVIGALHGSLADSSVEHGPVDDGAAVANAWSDEIARRLAEIDGKQVTAVPAEEAEKMIRGDGE